MLQQSTARTKDQARTGDTAATGAKLAVAGSHPIHTLQKAVGNRAVQRMVSAGQNESELEGLLSPDGSPPLASVLDEALGSAGSPLDRDTRAFMESSFGHDFSNVRIHADSPASTSAKAISANAYTVGEHLVFGAGKYSPGSSEGRHLIAHELTHVVQQSTAPSAAAKLSDSELTISEPSDESEQIAEASAAEVMRGGGLGQGGVGDSPAAGAVQRDDDDEGIFSRIGGAISDAGSAVASGVGSAIDAGEGLASSAGSAIASGVGSAIDAGEGLASSAGSAVASGASAVGHVAGEAWQGAKSVAGDVAGFGKEVYGQMKEDAGYVQKGVGAVGEGIDWLEGKAKGGTSWLAQKADGIPVLSQVANAGKSLVDFNVDVLGGGAKAITGMAGGLLGAAADPVDAGKAIYGMTEHIPGLGLPQKLLGGAYDLAQGKSLGAVADETLNPAADAKYWGNIGKGLLSPYEQAIAEGKPGEAVGRGAIDIGSLLLGVGEAGAAGKVGEIAEATDAAKVADLADAGKLADVGNASEIADASGAANAVDNPALRGMDIKTLGEPTGELGGLTDAEIDSFVEGMDGNARSSSYFEMPAQNPATGGGLQDIVEEVKGGARRPDGTTAPYAINGVPQPPLEAGIPYNVNHYFSDVGAPRIADMSDVPIDVARGEEGVSVIPEGTGVNAQPVPQTTLSTPADTPVLNGAGNEIGNANAEVRYHSENPRFPDQGPTVQVNTPANRFGWGGDRSIGVQGAQGRYMLPDGTWRRIADMTDAERAAAHWPTGG